MTLFQHAWVMPAAIGLSSVLLVCWLGCFCSAMAPRKGTLEWISRTVRGRFSSLCLQPLRLNGWIALFLSAAAGVAWSLFQSGTLKDVVWEVPVVTAVQTAAFALLLFLLYGSPLSAVCGSVMLMAAGLPSPVVTLCLLLLFLALAVRPFWIQLFLYPAAAACLLLVEGSGTSVLLLLAAWIVLHALISRFRQNCSVWRTVGVVILWFCLTAGLAAVSVCLKDPNASVLSGVWKIVQGLVVWPSEVNYPALISALAAIPLLVYAVLLQNTAWLFGALAALFSLIQLFFGIPELAIAGGILALCGTFAAAEKRGARWNGLVLFVLLTFCIFIS